jgi:tetratricopeptide (TPR) repeat protein
LLTPATVDEAEPYLRTALNLLRPLGPTKQLASCLKSLSLLQTFRADYPIARPLLHESMTVAQSIGDTRGLLSAEINLAELEFACGELDVAISRIRRMIESGLHNRRQLALGLSNLTAYLIAAARMDEAKRSAEMCLEEARVLGDPAAVARIVEHIAVIALQDDDLDLAAQLLGFGSSFYARGTASREYTEQMSYQAALSHLEKAFSREALARLFEEGAAWTDEQAVARSLAFCRSFSDKHLP